MFKNLDRQVISWALYDWANSAYATVVMAGFFPLFFQEYWDSGVNASGNSFEILGFGNAIASIIIVLLAPILGAIADAGGIKKILLACFAVLGIVATAGLFFAEQGEWILAISLFILGTIGFSGANIFYDALLISVSPRDRFDFISALGFALGYLGGGLLFAFDVLMFLKPDLFGLSGQVEAIRISFITVAIWWALFSIPLLMFVHEKKTNKNKLTHKAVLDGWRQLVHTFDQVRKLRVVFVFLIAYWLYIDGVDTIVRMAIAYGQSIGLESNHLITALLITQFVGFPAAIAFGLLGARIGAKRGIFIAIGVYIGVTIWAFRMTSITEFYGLAIVVGLVQGGVQSLSRSFYARIIPANKSAEFFGFYNMLGKFAAVFGPLIMGVVGLLTKDPRLAILSIIVLFIAGGVLLWFVDEEKGRKMAQELE